MANFLILLIESTKLSKIRQSWFYLFTYLFILMNLGFFLTIASMCLSIYYYLVIVFLRLTMEASNSLNKMDASKFNIYLIILFIIKKELNSAHMRINHLCKTLVVFNYFGVWHIFVHLTGIFSCLNSNFNWSKYMSHKYWYHHYFLNLIVQIRLTNKV